jgi:hypothetical protein
VVKGLQFNEFLEALKARGQQDKADSYLQAVTNALQDTLSPSQVLCLPMKEVLSFFDVFNGIVETSKTHDSINKRMVDLERKGFCVMEGKHK